MASITDIKRRILELAPAPFQEFCDTLISKQGVGVLGIPTKEQFRQIATPQQKEKTATTCCRIMYRESEKTEASDADEYK